MKSLDKSANSHMLITVAVLGVVAILITVIFAYGFYTYAKEKLESQNCKISIAAHAAIAGNLKREFFSDIKCPTRYMKIDAEDDRVALKTIGDDMARCWWEWGKGNLTLFKGDGVFCHVCAIYSFKQPDKRIDGIMKFLAKERPEYKYTGTRKPISYQDFFQGFTSPKAAELLDKTYSVDMAKIDFLDTDKKYAAVFFYVSGKEAIEKFIETKRLGFTVGSSLTILAGSAVVVGKGSAALGVIGTLATGGTVTSWSPVGWVLLGAAAVGAGGYFVYKTWFADSDPGWMSFVTFREYNENEIKDLDCQKIETNQLSHSTKVP